jgi:DNA invertase Pin-like site-specific DNA recombinase
MLVGYARVSSHAQNLKLQLDALTFAGCEKIFEESVSGVAKIRPQLKTALSFVRPGDTFTTGRM